MLEKLLASLENFLTRFGILYEDTQSKGRLGLDRITAGIMAHLFNILALVAKFLRKGLLCM